MKKVLLGAFLILSIGTMADNYNDRFEGQEKMIEKNLEFSKKNLMDKKNQASLKNIDYEVNIFENNVIVNLDMETFSGLGDWEKFDKNLFDQEMKAIAEEIKTTLNNQTIPISISLEIDKEIGEEQLVYSKIF